MHISINPISTIVEKHYRVLLLLLFIGIVSSGGYFIVLPQYYQLQNSGVLEYDTTKQTLAQRQQYLQDLQTMQQNFNQLDTRILAILPQVLPVDYDPVLSFTEIEQLLAAANFTIQSINVAPVAEEANPTAIKTLRLTVNIVGQATSYEDFKKFLSYLEDYPHLIELDNLAYTPDSNSFTLVFSTYYTTAL